jgi:hypothetical protein
MRAFDINAAASALDVSPKWLDNLLSHHDIPGVVGGRQGVRRRISPDAILRIAVAMELARELGSPLRRALGIAEEIVEAGMAARGKGFELRLDITSIADDLNSRLAEATEASAPRRRGRPPGASGKPVAVARRAEQASDTPRIPQTAAAL